MYMCLPKRKLILMIKKGLALIITVETFMVIKVLSVILLFIYIVREAERLILRHRFYFIKLAN